MTDEELFNSATTDEPVEQEQGQPRDEHGRFASVEAEPEPQPEPQPAPEQPKAKEDAHVPSWRLREEREAREAAERRFQEAQSTWQRQFEQLQSRLPKEEPKPPPHDLYENPNEFVEYNVKQAVDPIDKKIGEMREFYSRRDAEREHGPEKVKAAYDWIAQGMASRDPDAVATYQRAMQSMHPFGELVTAHQQRTVYQQIGSDPSAWFEKTFEQRLADPKFAATVLQKIQQSTRQNPSGTTVQIPPSLNRATSAAPPAEDDDDGEGGLLRSALRR